MKNALVIFTLTACILTYAALAVHRPHVVCRPPAVHRHFVGRPPFRPHVIHHGHSTALPFMTGFAAGAAISTIFAPRTVEVIQQPAQVVIPPPPVVVSPATTVVWVPGGWVETRKNGIVVSRQWVEGHWEYR